MANRKYFFYIDSLGIGGAERVIANIANGMAKKGHSVIVVNDVEADGPEYPLHQNIKRIILGKHRYGFVRKTVRRILDLRRIIRKEKPNIAISFKKGPNYRLIIAKMTSNCKIVVSVRSDPAHEYGKGLKHALAWMLFLFSDGVVFQTEQEAEYFSKATKNKSAIIFNPVKGDFFSARWNGIENRIVCVGRLENVKKPLILLEAFYNIKDDFPETKLAFVGDGYLRSEMEAYCKEHHISGRVDILGRTENVSEELSRSRVYVLCSEWEGMPNALMEAMAVGVPVIAADCMGGGPRSLIRNEKEGILISPLDTYELECALRKLLSDAAQRQAMSEAERKRAEAFREDVVLDMWEKYIQKIMLGIGWSNEDEPTIFR